MSFIKNFKNIMQESNTNKVVILTDSYKISGNVFECDKCNTDGIINLKNISLCKINDTYSDGISACDEYSISHFEWFHINIDKIVAFSFIKE